MIHQKVHDRLGNEILYGLPRDRKVRSDQGPNERRLHLFSM